MLSGYVAKLVCGSADLVHLVSSVKAMHIEHRWLLGALRVDGVRVGVLRLLSFQSCLLWLECATCAAWWGA